MKKFIKIFILSVLILFTAYWSLSILKCEYLTYVHKNEFIYDEEIKDSALVKILEYNDDYARLYCINYNVHSGSLCTFLKKDGKWIFKSWGRGVWSRHGSADGFIWPYGR